MKKRMLLITNGFPFGESERSFLGVESQYLAQTFDLYVMAPENQEPLRYSTDGILEIFGYDFSAFHESRDISTLFRVLRPSTLAEAFRLMKRHGFRSAVNDFKEVISYRFHAWEAEQKISRLINEKNIDIVYTYWCTECTLGAVLAKRRFPGLKVVTRFHGMDLYEERSKLGWQMFRRKIAAGADGLYFACEAAMRYFLSHWGRGGESKARLCYLGSPGAERICAESGQTLHLVSCANLIPLKRVDHIIDGLALLPESAKVRWDHFGDGAERERLEKQAEEKLAFRENVIWKFQGAVPNKQLLERYREIGAELFITTSSTEGGAPVSIQEAFSMGIPAIGTNVGGIPDLVKDGKTGFLLPEDPTAEDVSKAILTYSSYTSAQRQEMKDAALELWQEKFDARKNAIKFVEQLKDLVSK